MQVPFQEIVEFCRFVQPTAEEQATREAGVERVRAVVRDLHPESSVQIFGSFASGLYLPTSDMDLVVMESGTEDVRSALEALSTSLLLGRTWRTATPCAFHSVHCRVHAPCVAQVPARARRRQHHHRPS